MMPALRFDRLAWTCVLVASAGAAAFLAACENRRVVEPLTGESPQPPNEALRQGMVLFMHNCHQCHPNGNTGVGPALIDKPLPAALIKAQIRAGLGKMPAFPPEKLSDAQTDAIARYVIWLRESHTAAGSS